MWKILRQIVSNSQVMIKKVPLWCDCRETGEKLYIFESIILQTHTKFQTEMHFPKTQDARVEEQDNDIQLSLEDSKLDPDTGKFQV